MLNFYDFSQVFVFTTNHHLNMFNHICPDGQRTSGGTSIMVKSSVPHSQFDFNTNLQAVAGPRATRGVEIGGCFALVAGW